MTITQTSTIYRTWRERIESGVFTKAQCNQWAQAVVPTAYGESPRGKKTNLSQEEAEKLVTLMERGEGVSLTTEHTEQGIAYLRRYGAKKIGIPQEYIDAWESFTFQGRTASEDFGSHTPVWQFTTTTGYEIAYYTTSWQSGNASDWWIIRKPL